MGGFINHIIKNIIAIVIWAVAASMAFGTFGLSMVAGFFAHAIADAVISDEDINKPRSKDVRMKVAGFIVEDLKKKQSELMQEFNTTLLQQTASFDDALDKVLETAFEIVTLKRFDM